jgi:MFS family permease
MTAGEDHTRLLRSPARLFLPVFLPVGIYEVGVGAATPAIALLALQLGASGTVAAAILALIGIGQIVGDLPASTLAGRVGDRRAMLIASVASIVAAVGGALAPNLVVLALATMLFGGCNAVFYLARQTFVTDVAHPSITATAMSAMGGAHRVGLFVGPVIAAAAVAFGGLRAAFLVGVLSGCIVVAILLPTTGLERNLAARRVDTAEVSWRQVIRRYRAVLCTVGVIVAAIGAVRASKITVLPLWAHAIGLSPEITNLVVAVSAGLELVVFYPAGRVMDRWGRSWVAVPAMVILGAAMVALPSTSGLVTIMVVAALMGLGNGLGSGIVMTFAADVSGTYGRTKFIGLWRLLGDSGSAAGPAAVAVVTAAASLTAAIVALGGLGVITAVVLAAVLPIFNPYAMTSPKRRAKR